jgi:hypothetical protein
METPFSSFSISVYYFSWLVQPSFYALIQVAIVQVQ